MASIRKRGNSYLLVVSMGYDYNGKRRKQQQKTVKPPTGLTKRQCEKWLEEQAVLFEMECKNASQPVKKDITLEKYIELWLLEIAPHKLAKSTLARDKQDIVRILPHLGHYKLAGLRPEHFRKFYADMRKERNQATGKLLSESTIEGLHSCLCGILSDAEALENESIKYETYFKLIIATGMRRGERCGLKREDIDYQNRTIHIQRNVVKITGKVAGETLQQGLEI